MPGAISLYVALIFLFYSFIFGFGFAIGGWLWGLIVGAIPRRDKA
jgi:hypothetical protein